MHSPGSMRFWQLPANLRSLACTGSAVCRRSYSVTRRPHDAPEPLRILFCGSDYFSIESLRALNQERLREDSDLIQSIDVVHRPAKPTGRGLKTLREVPIQHVATSEFKLPTHAIDTFTGWTPPVPFNLVVAVSFGLLVPPRILNLAKYGGLNVHPSLLPDLRGPAPIEHAILERREHTGVSIQTLHPRHFDQGTVLAQTPAPGILIPRTATAAALETQLATQGAQMLLDALKEGKHIPPHQDVGWYNGPISHAPKTTKQDRFVRFADKTLDEMNAIQQALGFPWCMLSNGNRLLLNSFKPSRSEDVGIDESMEPGLYIKCGLDTPVFRTKDGEVGVVNKSTYSGTRANKGNAKIMTMLPRKNGLENSGLIGSLNDWMRVDQH